MPVINVDTWGKPKTRKSRKEITDDAIRNSVCNVNVATERGNPSALVAVSIEFHGELARTPNLKNRKIPNQTFTNPDVEGRLIAMDRLFGAEQLKLSTPLTFEDEPVFILLYVADRDRDFDVDSCMVTIRDWLEPSEKIVGKNVRKRGWGIGLINNDSAARGIPLKWSDVGQQSNSFTYIEVLRRRDVDSDIFQFTEKISRRRLLRGENR